MKILKFLFVAAITVCNLSACVSTYVGPTGKDTAKLKITNNADASLYIMVFKDGENCKGWQKLNIPKEKQAHPGLKDHLKQYSSISINVEANKVFSINADAQIHTYSYIQHKSCQIIGSFLPEENQTYEATYSINEDKCFLSLIRLVENEDKFSVVNEKSFRQREVVGWDQNAGSICK